MHALKTGYCHIDSAFMYGTEWSCGEAVRRCGLERGEVFITSKYHKCRYAQTKEAIKAGVRDSGLGYLDLYLIHSS